MSRGGKFKTRPDMFLSAIIIWMALMMLLRICMVHIIGENGIAMVSASLELVITFAGIYMFAYEYATAGMIRSRMRREQLQNAVQGTKLACKNAFISALVISLVVVLFALFFGERWIAPPKTSPTVMAAAVCLLLMSTIGVMRGFLETYGRFQLVLRQIVLQGILGVVFAVIFGKIGYRYGLYVNALLKVTDCAPAYGAFGCIVGIGISLLITLCFTWFAYRKRMNKIMEQVPYGSPKYLDKSSGIIGELKNHILPIVSCGLLLIVDQRFFFHFASHRGESDVLQNWGIYYGCGLTLLVLLALLCSLPFAKNCYKCCAQLQHGDYTATDQFEGILHHQILILLPVTMFGFVLAEPLMNAVFHLPKDNATVYFRQGILLVLFGSFAITAAAMLNRLRRRRSLLVGTLLALAVHALVVLLLDLIGKRNLPAYIFAYWAMLLAFVLFAELELSRLFRVHMNWIWKLLVPAGCALASSLVVLLLRILLIDVVGEVITLILSFAVGTVIYFVLLFLLRALDEYDLYDMPGGSVITSIAKRMHLLTWEEDE